MKTGDMVVSADWYQNGGNYGLMLKDDYELSGYTEFLSSDCDNGYQDMRPRIDISYPMRRKTPCFSYGDIRRVHRIYASN